MMYGSNMNGWDWAWMSFMMIIGTAAVVFVVFALVRGLQSGAPTQQLVEPLDILAQRFARGEIDDAEYKRRRDALQL